MICDTINFSHLSYCSKLSSYFSSLSSHVSSLSSYYDTSYLNLNSSQEKKIPIQRADSKPMCFGGLGLQCSKRTHSISLECSKRWSAVREHILCVVREHIL